MPKVTWFKDETEIDKRMMIEITTISGSSTLFIRDGDRSHRGIYMVEATNSSGTKKEKINVQVLGLYFKNIVIYYMFYYIIL